MKFQKGNKFGKGRPKGSKNKATKELREFFSSFLHRHTGELESAFKKLEPREKFKVMLDMAKYVIPTLKAQGSYLEELTDDQFTAIVERIKRDFELE